LSRHINQELKTKKYIDAQMQFNSKSAIAEDHFQKGSYYIIQERQITRRHARQSKALKAQ